MSRSREVSVVCFGEVLWDVLPRGIFLGGAPLNVAYHLAQQGVEAVPVSAVGRDFLGEEARRRIVGWKVTDRYVMRRRGLPTGTVRATLDSAGVATYRIAENVAWDDIGVSAALRRRPEPAAVVFGTLALRGVHNRATLARLLEAWPKAWRVLDLNLRAPFDRGVAVEFALRRAQVVKLNDDELGRMLGRPLRPQDLERGAREFAAAHGISRVCVTAGARGAGLLWDERWSWEQARPVQVRDTVGSGDAFLAALLASLLRVGATPRRALAAACRLGEYVATQDGATGFRYAKT